MKISQIPFDPSKPGMTANRDGAWVSRNADGTYDVWGANTERFSHLSIEDAQAKLDQLLEGK